MPPCTADTRHPQNRGATVTTIHRLAIVNRGEPAMRCISAVAELNQASSEPITTIALYTEPDAASWFVREAERGGAARPGDLRRRRRPPQEHLPRPRPADGGAGGRPAPTPSGWAGASSRSRRSSPSGARTPASTSSGRPVTSSQLLGDKVRAKQLAESVGVPVVPWSGGPVHDADSALLAADLQGYPVLVKAAAGGGGRGIRLVESARSDARGVRLGAGRGRARVR